MCGKIKLNLTVRKRDPHTSMKKTAAIIFLLIVTSCSVHKEFYDNGVLKSKGKVSDRLRYGEWKFYYDNGQLRQIGEFENGKQTGEWNFFHANGNREGIGTLVNGAKEGIWTWYHTNGKIYTKRVWGHGKLIKNNIVF